MNPLLAALSTELFTRLVIPAIKDGFRPTPTADDEGEEVWDDDIEALRLELEETRGDLIAVTAERNALRSNIQTANRHLRGAHAGYRLLHEAFYG